MNFSQLSDALKIQNGTVTVAPSLSAAIRSVITGSFGGTAITISNAVPGPGNGENEQVVITGTSGILNKEALRVIALFFLDTGGNAQMLLRYGLAEDGSPGSWKFSDSFSDLPTDGGFTINGKTTPLLDNLALLDASFIVSSQDRTDPVRNIALKAGINFAGRLTPSAILGIFEDQLKGVASLPVYGTIVLPADGSTTKPLGVFQYAWDKGVTAPGILLNADLGIDLELGGMKLNGCTLRLYSPTSSAWLSANDTFVPVAAFTCTLGVASANISVSIAGVMQFSLNTLMLRGEFSGVSLANLASMAGMSGDSDLLSSLPSEIKSLGDKLGTLQLSTAALILTTGSKGISVTGAYFSIGMPDLNWHIWNDDLVVKSISADFSIQSPLKKPRVSVTVTGKVTIGGAQVSIAASNTDGFAVYAELENEVSIPLNALVSKYAPGIPAPSDLSINQFNMNLVMGKQYTMAVGMAAKPNPWTIPLGFNTLTVSDVILTFSKASGASATGSFMGTIALGDIVSMDIAYVVPGSLTLRGEFPTVSLSDIAGFLLGGKPQLPAGFDLTFEKSYLLLEKKNSDYSLQFGTTVSSIGTLVFVFRKSTGGNWGMAFGVAITKENIGNVAGVGNFVRQFNDWFPFDKFVLAVSTLKDTNFTFPGFQQFNVPSLGGSTVTLPASVSGIDKGFYLYTSTVFTKKNKVLSALIDLLGIPEGTQLDAMLAYLFDKSQFQMGVSITTYLTPTGDPATRSQGINAYKNNQVTGTIFVNLGGPQGFGFGLSAGLKTIIQNSNVDFDITLLLVSNGIFVSGTMDNKRPIDFGAFQVAGLAVQLGISFEGIPSFGFAGSINVKGLFHSSVAVMIDSTNPSNSMVAGSLSDLTLKKIVDTMIGSPGELPQFIDDTFNSIGISGSMHGRFSVPAASANTVSTALNNYDAPAISNAFAQYGSLSNFPDSSEGLTLYVDTPGKQWYITSFTGAGDSSLITHYQLSLNSSTGAIDVSKEAQLYFVPNPSGTNIGKFYYKSGFMISGEINFLFIKLDVDVLCVTDKGLKIDAELEKIVIGAEKLFSITAAQGGGGPKLSVCSFDQPNDPVPQFRKPHLYVNGQLTFLGINRSVFASLSLDGASFSISGTLVPLISTGTLEGRFDSLTNMDVAGDINVKIGQVDLGKLGSFSINTGVSGRLSAFVKGASIGAGLAASFTLAGTNYSLGNLTLDINTTDLTNLASFLLGKVADFLKDLFTDPKKWAQVVKDALNWAEDKITGVLESVFGLSPEAAKVILTALFPVCAATSALLSM